MMTWEAILLASDFYGRLHDKLSKRFKVVMSLIPNICLGYGYETEHSSHSEERVAHETAMGSIK
jgi:hypothetical protein